MAVLFRQESRSTLVFRVPPTLKPHILMGLLLTAVCALTVLIFYTRIQPEVPLFYSLALPEEQLVAKPWLFLFPTASFLILVVHTLAINLFAQQDMDSAKIFVWSMNFLLGLLYFALIRILFIIM